jgi:hypothetical protein
MFSPQPPTRPVAPPGAIKRANRANQRDAAHDEQQPPSQPVTGSITAAVP